MGPAGRGRRLFEPPVPGRPGPHIGTVWIPHRDYVATTQGPVGPPHRPVGHTTGPDPPGPVSVNIGAGVRKSRLFVVFGHPKQYFFVGKSRKSKKQRLPWRTTLVDFVGVKIPKIRSLRNRHWQARFPRPRTFTPRHTNNNHPRGLPGSKSQKFVLCETGIGRRGGGRPTYY